MEALYGRESDSTGLLIRDPLTNAFTRALFETRIQEEIERARRYGTSCVLCLFDIDHFKSINDAYGHGRGDQILRDLVRLVQEQVIRGTDLLFRYGGDEFVLLLPQTGKEQAHVLCQRLFSQLHSTVFEGPPALSITLSMGVASFPDDGQDAALLVSVADRRNYSAKRQGRNQWVATEPQPEARLSFDSQAPLVEREAALDRVQRFFDLLPQHGRGMLSIKGAAGTGRTRLLEHAGQLARQRNYGVLLMRGSPASRHQMYGALQAALNASWSTSGRSGEEAASDLEALLLRELQAQGWGGMLVAVEGWEQLDYMSKDLLLRLVAAASIPNLALAYTTAERLRADTLTPSLPHTEAVELAPLSQAGLAVWLHTLLGWEPPSDFLRWLGQSTEGVPGRVQVALTALVEQGLLHVTPQGWSLKAGYNLHVPGDAALGVEAQPARLSSPLLQCPLLGREEPCWQINALLDTQRLVTLAGPAGIGKTRLALEVAGQRRHQYAHGVWFIALGRLPTPDLVVPTIARALGIREHSPQPIAEILKAYLRPKRLLLILDGFEQVLDAALTVVEVLNAAPQVSALITSRERLFVSGEHIFTVPPLRSPNPGEPADLAGLRRAETLSLFIERARRHQTAFTLTEENAGPLVEVCALLKGVPLALELVALHSDRLAPDALLAQLRERMAALPEGDFDLTPRRRAVYAALDWCYSLLAPPQQRFLARLAVFQDQWTAESAERICVDEDMAGPEPAAAARFAYEWLGTLAARQLVQASAGEDGSPCFTMLKPVREYLWVRLRKLGELDALRDRHAEHYLRLVERAEPLLTGPDQAAWIERLAQEHAELGVALGWMLELHEQERPLRLVSACWKFWQFQGYHRQGRAWLERVIQAVRPGAEPQGDDPAVRQALQKGLATALYAAGRLAKDQGDLDTPGPYFEESLRLFRALGDQRGVGLALQGVAGEALRRGDHRYAEACLNESRDLFYAIGDLEETAWVMKYLASLGLTQGDWAAAERWSLQALEIFEGLGHEWGISITMGNIGPLLLAQGKPAQLKALLEPWIARPGARLVGRGLVFARALAYLGQAELLLGNLERAEVVLQQALVLCREGGDSGRIAHVLACLGQLALSQECLEDAQRYLHESLQLQTEAANPAQVVHVVEQTAALALALRAAPASVLLYGAADALREAYKLPVAPAVQAGRTEDAASLRAQLGPEELAALQHEAAAMDAKHAISAAIRFLVGLRR